MARKISNGLVALSSAAVLAVYTAGYLRTKPAADRFTALAAQRRPEAAIATIAAPPAEAPPRLEPDVTAAGPLLAPRTSTPAPTPAPTTRAGSAKRPDAPAVVEAAPEPAPGDSPAPAPLATIESASPAVPSTLDLDAREAEPPAAPTAPPRGPYADGTYTGWGYSRHGDIEATVVVEGGRMASAEISQCRTRYSCSVVAHLPGQVLSRQRAKVDFVSGATQSSYAYEDAVAQALAKAK